MSEVQRYGYIVCTRDGCEQVEARRVHERHMDAQRKAQTTAPAQNSFSADNA
jgi:hypothetical protein